MAINWVLPVRAVQGTLSCAVLGLMAYGMSLRWRPVCQKRVEEELTLAQLRPGGQHIGVKCHR